MGYIYTVVRLTLLCDTGAWISLYNSAHFLFFSPLFRSGRQKVCQCFQWLSVVDLNSRDQSVKTEKLSNGRLFGTLKGGCGTSTYCLAGKVIFGELVICEINYQIRSVCSLHYKCVSSSSLNPINSRVFFNTKNTKFNAQQCFQFCSTLSRIHPLHV